ncbi:HAMP domain-containing protein [Sinosporangium album]|uniref:histidine kinase n=1 Tax=Sinosporangium album TaxID=504805 RepID=A0A1G8G4C8_9ACTN|nr:HAMP domain-containing protein [Sinosporangium album]SDH89150.1 HAMP domain-containing protein [Sinosporangium album]
MAAERPAKPAPGRPHLGVPRAGQWWRRRDLRFRLTAAATAVFALALTTSAFVMVRLLAGELLQTIDDDAHQRARTVVADADTGRLTNPIVSPEGTMVQVIEADQRIIHATAGTDRLVPLLSPAERERALRLAKPLSIDGRPYGIAAPLRVVVLSADRGRTVIAAKSSAEVERSITTTGKVMHLGIPLLLVMFAWTTHLITGRTLRPIMELRRGAADITGTARSRRLPVPESRDEVHSLATTLNDMLSRLEAAELRQRALDE